MLGSITLHYERNNMRAVVIKVLIVLWGLFV